MLHFQNNPLQASNNVNDSGNVTPKPAPKKTVLFGDRKQTNRRVNFTEEPTSTTLPLIQRNQGVNTHDMRTLPNPNRDRGTMYRVSKKKVTPVSEKGI